MTKKDPDNIAELIGSLNQGFFKSLIALVILVILSGIAGGLLYRQSAVDMLLTDVTALHREHVRLHIAGSGVVSGSLPGPDAAVHTHAVYNPETRVVTGTVPGKSFRILELADPRKPFSGYFQLSRTCASPCYIVSFLPGVNRNSVVILGSDVSKRVRAISSRQLLLIGFWLLSALMIAVFLFVVMRRRAHQCMRVKQVYLEESERLRHQANHDVLTGLPTNELFVDRLGHAIQVAARKELMLGVLAVTVKGIDDVIDQLSSDEYNEIVQLVTNRLASVLRDADTLSRRGGCEFSILLEHINELEQLQVIASRLFILFDQPAEVLGRSLPLTVHIGLNSYPSSKSGAEAMLLEARTAMNKAVGQAGHAYHYYSEDMQTEIAQRMFVNSGMARAMQEDELELYFQPKISLGSWSMTGVEALLRWWHPEKGMVSPAEFIPILEKSSLIIEVGAWVLRKACQANRKWQDEGRGHLKIAVNVSPRQFNDRGFVENFTRIVSEEGCEPGDIEIEITEGSLVDDMEASINVLQALKSAGFTIAIDDFGTGYSSLSYLQRFPVDTLKIDRAFVKDLHESKDSAAIVTTIMGLSHNLRMNVVAEGVEKMEQLTFLNALGCQIIQGFLFSRPLSMTELEALDQGSWEAMKDQFLGRGD